MKVSAEHARAKLAEMRMVGGGRRDPRGDLLSHAAIALLQLNPGEKPGLTSVREASFPFASPTAHVIQYTIGRACIFLSCLCHYQLSIGHSFSFQIPLTSMYPAYITTVKLLL